MTLIISTSRKPGFNLAAEEYLFSQHQDNIFFFYVNNPCVVIGNNQSIHYEVNLNYCRNNKIEIMRRLSGGGAVYHDNGNLNFCIIRNREEHKFPLGTDFLKPIVKVLNDRDIPVETGKRKDLWLDGFKVSGTAAHIGNKRAMHHGTLLYDCDLDHLKHSLAAESPDCISEGYHSSSHLSEYTIELPKEPVRLISSVSSPVMNIRTYLENKGMEAPSSLDFFKLIFLDFLKSYELPNPTGFTLEETARIIEIQKTIYQKVHWIYKK